MVLRINFEPKPVSHSNWNDVLSVNFDLSLEHLCGKNKITTKSFRDGSFLESFSDIIEHLIAITWEYCLLIYFLGNLVVH